ncbi:hypothetical protein ASD83_04615 [Devosia sp. Root685]|nr:hypothetical protein ASD83_04615 [Devosia sp. Root685]
MALYASAGMQERLIQWQDEAGADVCIVLALLYAQQNGIAVDDKTIAELEALVSPWRVSVVQPLREVRRYLKPAGLDSAEIEALRSNIKMSELAAEQHELRLLAGALSALPADLHRTEPPLPVYAKHLGAGIPRWPELTSAMKNLDRAGIVKPAEEP